MKNQTCCFTGHRQLPKDKLDHIVARLDCEINALIARGVTHFISGCALGFDQIAASLILTKKEQGTPVTLTLALPCKDQDALWNERQKRLYRRLLSAADEIYYVSEIYDEDCMKRRNMYMADQAAYCICAYIRPYGGTAQTVRYARRRGLTVINVAE
ncbi:MAG: DUF1273 domain-containing protein [Oscillospiraceae bacterium]|nr:DUF1273 domain-containing protein [Oscillospiraceae bacterium]